MNLLGKKVKYFENRVILTLFVICISSIIVRLFFFPYGIPLTLDALFYFHYAIDTSILGHYPSTPLINNGWPLFVSVFFSIFHSNNFLDYMTLQRMISVSISSLTIILVYLLVQRFFEPKYALLGAFLFAFEPRSIQISLLGLSDPLYILLVTLTLFFFLSVRKEIIYLSFSTAALAALVRYEGIVLFFLISIMYFVRYRKGRKDMAKYAIALGIFVLTLLPMSYARILTTGSDGISDAISSGTNVYGVEATSNQENKIFGILSYVLTGFQSLIKYLGWIMIPYFIFFVPLGAFLILKKRNSNNFTMILAIIILSIPALYAYSRGIQDTRYLYVLHPIFAVLSIFAIKYLQTRIRKIFLIIIIGVIASSIIFLTVKSTDYEYEKEAVSIAEFVVKNSKGVNNYYPETAYLLPIELNEKWPILKTFKTEISVIRTENFDSLKEFISFGKDEGLTHIVTDDNKSPEFIKDIFFHPEKYPYLKLVFDYEKNNFTSYHVRIYEINYEKFIQITENEVKESTYQYLFNEKN